MKMLHKVLIATALLSGFFSTYSQAHKHHQQTDGIVLESPWARPTFALAKTAAVYLEIINQGDSDTLLSVKVPETIAAKTEIHDMVHKNGMMSMKEITGGVELVKGQRVAFAPGGKHIMLLGLEKPLKAGMRFPAVLTFKHAGKVKTEVSVEQSDKKIKGELHHHNHH